MELVIYPDDRLLVKCKPILKFGLTLVTLGQDMFKIMYEHDGAGLSANQVGLDVRAFVTNQLGEYIICNPSWKPAGKLVEVEEACLSFSDQTVKTQRYERIAAKYQNYRGKKKKMTLEGFAAQVFQHESDHLSGVLFIDNPISEILAPQSGKE